MSFAENLSPEDFALALSNGQFGLAALDADGRVAGRLGRLSLWLPEEGAPAGDSPLLLGMDEALVELRQQGGEIVLPSMRLPDRGAERVTISIAWSGASGHYVVATTPDHGGDQMDRLMESERREKQLLQQQAEAAAARMRVADALYRDIVESSGDLVLRFTPDMRVVFANRLAARFLGLTQDGAEGKLIFDLFPARSGESPWRLDMAAGGSASFELAAKGADGAPRWLWWDVRLSQSGEFQAVARDVTDARMLRAAREAAQEEARAAAVANERLRIAHDLHDTLVRSIVTTITQLRLIAKGAPQETRAQLKELEAEAREGLDDARAALTRTREERRDEADLRKIVDMFAARSADLGLVDIRADLAAAAELPRETEELFARVLREALRNIELHSLARRVSIDLRRERGGFRLDVIDDGVGFDPKTPVPGHYGVAGMRERAEATGGRFEMSSAPGKGTRVTAWAGG